MSNTNYKLICKYAGAFPFTISKEYPYKFKNGQYEVVADDGTHFYFFDSGPFRLDKHFDLVPVEAAPDPIEPKVGQLWECVEATYRFTQNKIYNVVKVDDNSMWLIDDNLTMRELVFNTVGFYCFRFHSDPTEKAADPIMVQPADYIDPKLLEAYNALDENGKAIMREKMPDLKWSKPVRYITHGEYMDFTSREFGTNAFDISDVFVFNFPPDKYTPEINGGEIRFRVNE